MAKPDRKAPKGKPITSHQLFPAVVALWFAALFGLGSLAVRPSLLEDLVIRSRIDLIIPAAAPPLGVTARMLLALAMAALGAIVGAFFARRLGRTAQEPVQRKRSARSDEQGSSAAADPAPSMLFDRTDADPEPAGMLGGRRRALALDVEDDLYVPHDMAPLPGGAPQIFAVADMNLGEPMRPAEAPLDLAEMALEPADEPAGWTTDHWTPGQTEMTVLPIEDAGDAVPPRQVFGMAPTEHFDAAPRQVFGQTVQGDQLPGEFIREHGYQASVFETAEAEPLFAPRANAEPVEPLFTPNAASAPAIQVEPEPAPAPLASGEPAMIDLAHQLGDALRRRAARNAAARAAAVAADANAEAAEDCVIPPPYVPPLGEFDPSEAPVERPFAGFAPLAEPEAPAPQPAAFPAELPAALRPISFDLAESDEDAALLDSLLPPRHIAMPAPVPFASPEAPALPDPVLEEAEDDEDYGSLLNIGQAALARSPFVRIADDDDGSDAIEPVVIFPGQGAPTGLASFAGSSDLSAPDEAGPFRRFDAPAQAGQGQPIAAPGASAVIDPAETERALRSALVNLQRISGAA